MADLVTACAAMLGVFVAVYGATVAVRGTRRSIAALETPFVIPNEDELDGWIVPWKAATEERPPFLGMPLINIGRGPALLGDVRVTIDGKDLVRAGGGQIALQVSGELDYHPNLLGKVPADRSAGLMRIYYTSASGEEFMTRVQFKSSSGGILCTSYVRERSDRAGRPFLSD